MDAVGRRRVIWADMAAIAHRMSEARCLLSIPSLPHPTPGGGGLIEAGELERAGGEGVGR